MNVLSAAAPGQQPGGSHRRVSWKERQREGSCEDSGSCAAGAGCAVPAAPRASCSSRTSSGWDQLFLRMCCLLLLLAPMEGRCCLPRDAAVGSRCWGSSIPSPPPLMLSAAGVASGSPPPYPGAGGSFAPQLCRPAPGSERRQRPRRRAARGQGAAVWALRRPASRLVPALMWSPSGSAQCNPAQPADWGGSEARVIDCLVLFLQGCPRPFGFTSEVPREQGGDSSVHPGCRDGVGGVQAPAGGTRVAAALRATGSGGSSAPCLSFPTSTAPWKGVGVSG